MNGLTRRVGDNPWIQRDQMTLRRYCDSVVKLCGIATSRRLPWLKIAIAYPVLSFHRPCQTLKLQV